MILTPISLLIPIKIARHTGMDCRYLGHMDVIKSHHPWFLDSVNPCPNDALNIRNKIEGC